MNFRDQGIIISKYPLQERSCIVTIFTKEHGIYAGLLKQYSKKSGDSLAEGNLVDFFWNARLHEHLGTAKAELIKSYNLHIMMDKTKLYAFNSIVSLLKLSFCEREPHNNLFPTLINFIESLKQDFALEKYIELELAILAESGYRLQLDKCAATETTEDLYYVSPRSGRAVSFKAGAAYADKLLKLPDFLIKDVKLTRKSISEAFHLSSYFLERYIFLNKPEPKARSCFIEHIMNIM